MKREDAQDPCPRVRGGVRLVSPGLSGSSVVINNAPPSLPRVS